MLLKKGGSIAAAEVEQKRDFFPPQVHGDTVGKCLEQARTDINGAAESPLPLTGVWLCCLNGDCVSVQSKSRTKIHFVRISIKIYFLLLEF